MRILLSFSLFLVLLAGGCTVNRPMVDTDRPLLSKIQLPDGFRIDLFTESLPNARSLALGANGTIFVGSRSAGKVYALRDTNGDFRADERFEIAVDLNTPNGVAFRNGDLYVAEIDRILRFPDIESRLTSPEMEVISAGALPDDKWHGWKYIAFGPDDRLYVPVGAPCNICDEEDDRYASIMRMNADGSDLEVFVSGVRNSVGFDWHPETGELWFTENGRDLMGDDVPNDELNHAPQAGLHFGFPYCHAGEVLDPRHGEGKDCADYVAPKQKLAPHAAALGMKFYTGEMFPEEYQGQILIAEHGSWNRSEPIGYRLTLVRLNGNQALSYEPFATGWLSGDKAWGRPVDVLQLPDGSLLVSDDHADAIYRIYYAG